MGSSDEESDNDIEQKEAQDRHSLRPVSAAEMFVMNHFPSKECNFQCEEGKKEEKGGLTLRDGAILQDNGNVGSAARSKSCKNGHSALLRWI